MSKEYLAALTAMEWLNSHTHYRAELVSEPYPYESSGLFHLVHKTEWDKMDRPVVSGNQLTKFVATTFVKIRDKKE